MLHPEIQPIYDDLTMMKRGGKKKRSSHPKQSQTVSQKIHIHIGDQRSSKKREKRDDSVKLMPNRYSESRSAYSHASQPLGMPFGNRLSSSVPQSRDFIRTGPQAIFAKAPDVYEVGKIISENSRPATMPPFDQRNYNIVADSRQQPYLLDANPNSIEPVATNHRLIDSTNFNNPINPLLQKITGYDAGKEAEKNSYYNNSKPSVLPPRSELMSKQESPYVDPHTSSRPANMGIGPASAGSFSVDNESLRMYEPDYKMRTMKKGNPPHTNIKSGERYIEFREPNAEFNTAMRSREYHGEKKAIEKGESSRYLPTVPKKRGGRIG